LAGAAYLASKVPVPSAAPPTQTTFLTYADGTRLATLDSGQSRVVVPLDRIPKVVQQAVIATEDRKFYQHRGIDPVGILRALVANVRGSGARQGGSTITQQYVKITYTARQRTLTRKVREAVLAVKLERELSKDQILERYLNAVYFGRGAYGVQAAAQAYFGLDVQDLGLQQAAYLAGLIRAPQTADIGREPKTATLRRDLTLRSMVASRVITQHEADVVIATPLNSYTIRRADQLPSVEDHDIGTEYFVDMVRRSLIAKYGEATVLGGGLRVTTSLDRALQRDAYRAVDDTLYKSEPAGALVALDGDGHIVSMVGGRDYSQSTVNLALGKGFGGGGRQAGSTFKPFLLAETVHEGYTVESAFSAPPKFTVPNADNGKDYTVSNFEGESPASQINLIDATELSVNTVYIQLELAIGGGDAAKGAAKMAAMAKQLGVTSPLAANASLVLGSSAVSPMDMAAGYSSFADGGMQTPPLSVLQVTDRDGHVLEQAKVQRTQVLTTTQADVVTHCLQQVIDKGTGTGAQLAGGQPAAGKTGTTNNYADAWFVGYTPSRLTAAVWMGWPDSESRQMNDVRGKPVTGGYLPATIWKRFVDAAAKDAAWMRHGPADFAQPTSFPGVVIGRSGRLSGTVTTSTSVAGAPAGTGVSGLSPTPTPPGRPTTTVITPLTTVTTKPKPTTTTARSTTTLAKKAPPPAVVPQAGSP
jgi:penicillin-binding protein 1A